MFRFRQNVAFEYFFKIFPFFRVTLLYMFGALSIGVVFGSLMAVMKLGKNKALRAIAAGYTAVLRSLPPIVLIFLAYHGIPLFIKQVFGADIYGVNTIYFVILALGLSSIATLSEIIKSAYNSVSSGQYEAAISNGFPPFQAIVRIMLPQALRISVPNLGNAFVILMKDGSLGYTIGLIDIMGRANLLGSIARGNDIYEIYFILAAIYWIASLLIGRGFSLMEHRLSLERKIKQQEPGTQSSAA